MDRVDYVLYKAYYVDPYCRRVNGWVVIGNVSGWPKSSLHANLAFII
jgi:hypothetical protein